MFAFSTSLAFSAKAGGWAIQEKTPDLFFSRQVGRALPTSSVVVAVLGLAIFPRILLSGSSTGRMSFSAVQFVFVGMTIDPTYSKLAEIWIQCGVSAWNSRLGHQM